MPSAPHTAASTDAPAPTEAPEASGVWGSSVSNPAQPAPPEAGAAQPLAPEAGGRYNPDPRFTAMNGYSRRAADKSGYTTPAGRLPGATTVLGATSQGKQRLEQWLKRPDSAAVSHAARERGTWTHTQIENWIQGVPTEKHFAYGGYWRNIRPWLETHLVSALAIEGSTWHPAGYAGTFDAVAHLAYAAPDSPYSAHQAAEMVTLVDWKTSARPRTADLLLDYFDQLGAYSASILHTYGVQVDRGVLVIARPSGSTPDVYELTPDALAIHRARFFQRLNDYHAPRPTTLDM